MESDPGSDQVTPAVLPGTSMADMEMSSDIDMAGEMDLTTGVDFNSTLDVNHLLGIGAATPATEQMGADLDADAMFGSVSSTTGLLEDSMGMVDMSCSQSSGASSDVQGIVAMKTDNSSGDAAPPMSTRSSALSLQDSTSELFPVDFPSGLSTDDSNTMEMLTTKAAVVGSESEQNNDKVMSNDVLVVKESQECEAVDMEEPNKDTGHLNTPKELAGETVSPVEASDTSSPLDLTKEQNSNAQATGDCADKVTASCTVDSKLAGIIDAEVAGVKDVSRTVLTLGQLSTETEEVPKVDLRKRKLVPNVRQRRSTRLKPQITNDPTESSPSAADEMDKPEVAQCIEGSNVDVVQTQDVSTKDDYAIIEPTNEELTKDNNSSGDALVETVQAKESVKASVGLDVFEDSVVVSSPTTRRNVARRGRPRKRGRPATARGAKRQRTVLEGAGDEKPTELSPSAPILDKEQQLPVDETGVPVSALTQPESGITQNTEMMRSESKNLIAPDLQLEEDGVQNNGQAKTTSTVNDTKTDDDTSAASQTHTGASKASSESSDTVDYTEELPDVRQQEFTDEPLAVTPNTVSSLTSSEQSETAENVGKSGQGIVGVEQTQSNVENTDAVVGSSDPVVEVKHSLSTTEAVGETESSSGTITVEPVDTAVEPDMSRSDTSESVSQPVVPSEKEASVEAATVATGSADTEDGSKEPDARTDAAGQEEKPILCSSCSGNCPAPVKLTCSHVVCDRCAQPDGGTTAPQVCPVCKSGTSTEKDPAPVTESNITGNNLTQTEILGGEGGAGRTLLPTPLLPFMGLTEPEHPPPFSTPFQGPSEEECRGPGPPPPFRDPSLHPDGPCTFGPPPFRGPRPNCLAPPFRGPRPWQPRGPPPPFRGPCPRQHGPPFDIPHSGPDGPPPFRGPRPTSQPTLEGPRACGPRPSFRGPSPRQHGPPCDEPFLETNGPPYDDSYSNMDGPPYDEPYSEMDSPPFDEPYSEMDGPPFDEPYSEMDGPPFDEPYSEMDGPPFDEPHSEMDGPPPFRGPCGPPRRFRGPRPGGPPCDVPYSGPDGPPQFRGPPGPCGPPYRLRGPPPHRPDGPPPHRPGGPPPHRPDGPPPHRPGGPPPHRPDGPPPHRPDGPPPHRSDGPPPHRPGGPPPHRPGGPSPHRSGGPPPHRPGGPPPYRPGGPPPHRPGGPPPHRPGGPPPHRPGGPSPHRPGGPPPHRPGGPPPHRPGGPLHRVRVPRCDGPYSGPDGPPQQFRGHCPRPPFRGPCPGPCGPRPFRGPRPEGPNGQHCGPAGPYTETPLLSYPESEEQSYVDAGQGQGLTGSRGTEEGTAGLTEESTGTESTEQAAPPGSSGSVEKAKQQVKTVAEVSRKTLLQTPDHGYDVPPPGTEPAYDGYWSQQQGSQSGYDNTSWSEQQAPPPPPGWKPPQGGPPPPTPPYGPPPGGPGPKIPGPQALNVPPPNWYPQSYMQGGPQGWGYPPPPQQWQQPYWYGNNYDYYNYYQWYYNYYGQSQQYSSGSWPPTEWSVAANSLAAAAAATTSGSTSATTAVSRTKAPVASKLVVSTVSNRPMSSIPLPAPEVAEVVTSWPPTPPSQTVTRGPPPPPAHKPAVITATPRPAQMVTQPTRSLPPPQPVKSHTPVAVAQPAVPTVSPLTAPAISSVKPATMVSKTGKSMCQSFHYFTFLSM